MTAHATNIKESRIALRARPQDKAIIERAARLRGVKVSQFILEDAVKHAEEVLAEQGIMVLRDDDRAAFVGAFLEPHEPTDYMKRALNLYKKNG